MSKEREDEETKKFVDPQHRALTTDYHILVGQNAQKLLPDKVIHVTKDGKGEVRK